VQRPVAINMNGETTRAAGLAAPGGILRRAGACEVGRASRDVGVDPRLRDMKATYGPYVPQAAINAAGRPR
jgi:hypothetical protein